MKQTGLRSSGVKGVQGTPSRCLQQLRLNRKHRALVLSVLTSAVLLWPEAVVWGAGTFRVRQCGEFVAIIDAYHRELGRSPGGSATNERSSRSRGRRHRKNSHARHVRRGVAARRHRRSLARHARRRVVRTRTAHHQARSRGSQSRIRIPSRSSTASGVPQCRLFDSFGAINGCDHKARLDNFAIELQNEPSAQGYIIVYNGARHTRRNYAQELADKSKDYLISTRGIDASRIVTVDGGRRKELSTELWVVPSGAVPPTATPTVEGDK